MEAREQLWSPFSLSIIRVLGSETQALRLDNQLSHLSRHAPEDVLKNALGTQDKSPLN